MRSVSLCLFAAVLALTGCRDYVVNPVEPVPAPADDVRRAYIKGPGELEVGTEAEYKAELFQNVRYDWRLRGPVTLEATDDGTRYLPSRATLPGVATLEVLVFDHETGDLVARGDREIRVTTL